MSEHDQAGDLAADLGLGDINALAEAAGGVATEDAAPEAAAPEAEAPAVTAPEAVAPVAAPGFSPEKAKARADAARVKLEAERVKAEEDGRRLELIRLRLAEIGDPMRPRAVLAAQRSILLTEMSAKSGLAREVGNLEAQILEAQEKGGVLLEERRLLGIEAAKLGDPAILEDFPLGSKVVPPEEVADAMADVVLQTVHDLIVQAGAKSGKITPRDLRAGLTAWWNALSHAEKLVLARNHRARAAGE